MWSTLCDFGVIKKTPPIQSKRIASMKQKLCQSCVCAVFSVCSPSHFSIHCVFGSPNSVTVVALVTCNDVRGRLDASSQLETCAPLCYAIKDFTIVLKDVVFSLSRTTQNDLLGVISQGENVDDILKWMDENNADTQNLIITQITPKFIYRKKCWLCRYFHLCIPISALWFIRILNI